MDERKSYDEAFKKAVVKEYLSGQKSAGDLAKEYGIPVNYVGRWTNLQQSNGNNGTKSKGDVTLKPKENVAIKTKSTATLREDISSRDNAELSKARQRIKELEEDAAVLKRAMAYFVKISA